MQILFYILSILNGGMGGPGQPASTRPQPTPAVWQYYVSHEVQIDYLFTDQQVADFLALYGGGSGTGGGN